MPLSPDIISDLAPTGVLRAGINLSNFLLVTKVNSRGDPVGVAADLAGEVATGDQFPRRAARQMPPPYGGIVELLATVAMR